MALSRRPAAERGFTLIEVSIVVAILLGLAGWAYESLAQRPAHVHSDAVAFAGFVAQARSLAAITGAPTVDGESGASIGVVRDGDEYVATLYRYRPIRAAARAPERAANAAPLRFTSEVAIGAEAGAFALFFSTSGHVSAQPGFVMGVSAPLAAEPACPLDTGIVIRFRDATQTQSRAISCEMAQMIDPDGASGPATRAAGELPGQPDR